MKKMKRRKFVVFSISIWLVIFAMGVFFKCVPTPFGYRLLRVGCYWPFQVADVIWFIALLAWAAWSAWRVAHMKKG